MLAGADPPPETVMRSQRTLGRLAAPRAATLVLGAAVGLASLSAAPALAQGVGWLRDTPGLSRDDVDLYRGTLQSACEEQPDGGTQSWSNDRSGHHGSVTVVGRFEHEGMPCRLVVTSVTADKTVRSKRRVCRQADGVWRFLD